MTGKVDIHNWRDPPSGIRALHIWCH